MRELYVCNTSSDFISKIDLDAFTEKYKINLNNCRCKKMGPHGICVNDNKLLVANNYSNSLSIIDIKDYNNIENYFIGSSCNDLVVNEDIAYVICGDLNNVILFNLNTKSIDESIPCGNLPFSIDIHKEKKLLVVSNIQDDSLTLIDCVNRDNIKKIRVGSYPTKAMFTSDGNYILVCESNIGSDFRGNISIISLKNYNLVYRIEVGNSPIDMYYDGKICFVSNFGEGSISIVDTNCYKELKKINIGGMPRGIIKANKYIYVGDNYNNLLFRIDIEKEKKKVIRIGGGPTGMTIY